MLNQKFFSCTIRQITIDTYEKISDEQAKEIALKEANKRKYRGCTIEKIVVNGNLVIQNFVNHS